MNITEIISKLEENQIRSDVSGEYEKAVQEAFDALGYEAQLISGSGDTDVLLTANIGVNSYKVDVDAKTSKSGKIPDAQINWPSLTDHQMKNGSDYIVVVGPSFAGGNLEKRAGEFKVALLPNEQLVKLLQTHSKFPFSLVELKDLFSITGDISSGVDDLITQNKSRRSVIDNLQIIINEMEALQDRLGYFTFDSLAGREKLEELEIEPQDVENIINLLRLPFINAITSINELDRRYILALTKRELSNMFLTISNLILDKNELIEPLDNTVDKNEKRNNKEELATKYFEWSIDPKGNSIVANARVENPYVHYCPVEHFNSIIEKTFEAFETNNVVNVEIISRLLKDKEISQGRIYKGNAEIYKIRLVLGILEIEGCIKWTGSKRPIEYKLKNEKAEILKWKQKNKF